LKIFIAKFFEFLQKAILKTKFKHNLLRKLRKKNSKKVMRKKMVTENFEEKVMLLRNL